MHLLPDPAMPPGAGPSLTDARDFWQLPPHKLDSLLALTHQVDQMELKLVVPVDAHASACASLGADLSGAPARRVYYLDTADLVLERHGVVARVRRFENGSGDFVIKLRPITPDDLPARWRRSKRFLIEADALPGRFFCTGTLKRRLGMVDVEQVLGERSLGALFSQKQLSLLAAYAPVPVGFDELRVLGPVAVRRCRVRPDGLDGVLAVERWTYPDGSSILELSTRCPAEEAVPVAARVASVLRRHGIDVTDCQRTKTRATLAYFTWQSSGRTDSRHCPACSAPAGSGIGEVCSHSHRPRPCPSPG
jgi:hypothetical protein